MKLYVKFLALLLVLALAGPFFLKKPDGTPWMNLDDVLPTRVSIEGHWAKLTNSLSQVTNMAGRELGNEQIGKTQVYRWRAADGSLRYSDTPPAVIDGDEHKGVETLFVDPNRNLIQGLPEAPVAPESTEEPAAESSAVPMPMTVSPEQAKNLMDDARNIQTLIDERSQALENITGASN